MKLGQYYDFELEVGDNTYYGKVRDLTKKEINQEDKKRSKYKKMFDDLNKVKNKIDKTKRNIQIEEKLNNWESVKELNSKLTQLEDERDNKSDEIMQVNNFEMFFKERIEATVISEDIVEILEAGETYGYENVLNTIYLDVKDRLSKK